MRTPARTPRVEEVEPGLYRVGSFTHFGTVYEVDVRVGTCSCPAYARGKRPCKHQQLVARLRTG